jgi:hypothetical protein
MVGLKFRFVSDGGGRDRGSVKERKKERKVIGQAGPVGPVVGYRVLTRTFSSTKEHPVRTLRTRATDAAAQFALVVRRSELPDQA